MTRVLALFLLLSSLGAAAAEVRYETIAEGLSYPWSLAFLPDGSMLVTERDGQLRRIVDGRLLEEPVSGTPEVFVAGQGGLFEVLPDTDFADNRAVYLSYAHGRPEANSTRVARARLVDNALVDLEILFTAVPQKSTPHHYGGRM
ncbi:MAG: PQQ-dependent sugar dehydrogenase, partial [Pseudomonadota bacterium]